MLTKDQILEAVKNGRTSEALDGRDYQRLAVFFDADQLPIFGLALKDGVDWKAKEFTRENVLAQLREDVDFGFEKALDQRGISASLMHSVVQMWMWVLEDDLQHMDDYAQYGLPLFKQIAVKYGFDNPIGDDDGDESKYASE